jgi:hypothetical protein
VGLPAGVRRRTSGLRREEVASLAPISTEVLASLARALRLCLGERGHLFRLAGHPGARSVVYRFFTDDDVRRMYLVEDHPALARSFVAGARVACVPDGARSRAAQYVERLLRCSP